MKSFLIRTLLVACLTILMLSLCVASGVAEVVNAVEDVSILVTGYEWGPAVDKLILKLAASVTEVDFVDTYIITNEVERTVLEVYPCDANGVQTDEATDLLAVELETDYLVSGSPFFYNSVNKFNEWVASYPVDIWIDGLTVDGVLVDVDIQKDCINSRICPDAARFGVRYDFNGTYPNFVKGSNDEMVLHIAAYEPEILKGGDKNPLIIWLHGSGEGRESDNTILADEVSALTKPPIQSYFTAGSEKGAYVLLLTCETYWLDEGNNKVNPGCGASIYGDILMDAINDYLLRNPDADPNRIYVGGNSNGGYMALYLILENPGYFAAGYPIAEAYPYYEAERDADGNYVLQDTYDGGASMFAHAKYTDVPFLTEEKIAILKETPLWFVIAADDTVVKTHLYTLPTFQALARAGADNCWLSVFDNVKGTDHPGMRYSGHWSWVYLLNDQVKYVQDAALIAEATDDSFGLETNEEGGWYTVGNFESIFDWMNAQSK